MPPFVHLHTHSEYSLLDGAAHIHDLVGRAKDLDMPALALTDHGVMFGAIEFYKAATKAGIKPIIGCEVYFTTAERTRREGKPSLYHLLLLARNETGYRNLMAIVSDSWVTGYYYKPQVDEELLSHYSEGLIGTSACMSGILSKSFEQGQPDESRKWAERYSRIFREGDFYVELQEQGITADNGVTQKDINRYLSGMARELGLPTVATNDVHYVMPEDAKTQDMLLCIQTGKTLDESQRMRFSSDEFYMRSGEEMAKALPEYPEALASTMAIAERCDLEMEFGRLILPVFDAPDTYAGDLDAFLEDECMTGLARLYGDPPPDGAVQRLRYELEVIRDKGLAGYFLVVADFVDWAKEHGIGVGPGRGSAAGSIISYTLGITKLDPIEHGLLFERFLNPERTEMPDIDIDFDDERRDEVIEYVREKYGEDRVAQVVTYSRMQARAAVRDAGRILGYPFGVPDKIAKKIPAQPNIRSKADEDRKAIELALRDDSELRAEYEAGGDTKRILDAAMALETIVRGEGIHAAGVVICRDPLHEHMPIKLDTKGEGIITQYDGKLIASLGLLKMDFLGLRTLTVIAKAVAEIERRHGVLIDIDGIPLDDGETWELLQRADTDGVFQVESAGMKRVLTQLRPTEFADLVAVVALFRPGPMDYIPDYIDRKYGRKPVTYYDERLRPILEETYGRMVYQEQVMRISMEMSGFTAARADKLRKAMGKKDSDLIAAQGRDFLEGAVANGYERRMVEELWSDIEAFAKYAFNKSHAAAYALISYQTAYLKAHYPLEFMAANLSSYRGKTEEIVKYVMACKRGGIEVLPPDVNSSGADFTAVPEGIRFGLAGVRNVGEGVVELIVRERDAGGPFTSLEEFCDRVDMRAMNKRTVESLIKAGAFDSTGYTRKDLADRRLEGSVNSALKRQKDRADGQATIFDLGGDGAGEAVHAEPPDGVEWDKRLKLALEKEMLGMYVSDHPLREMADTIEGARTHSLGDAASFPDGTIGWFAGILTSCTRRVTRKGNLMIEFVLEDLDGFMEGSLFGRAYERWEPLLSEDAIVRIKARVESSDRGTKLNVMEVMPLADDGTFSRPPGVLFVRAGSALSDQGTLDAFKAVLHRHPGPDTVRVEVDGNGGSKVLALPETYRVNMRDDMLHAELKEMLGADALSEL